jgi:ABC-type phosphate transport system substrate-binding protein
MRLTRLRLVFFAPALLATVWGLPAAASEPVVIVNLQSGVEKLSRDQVINIFMGRQKRLPSGIVALPVEQAQSATTRARFYQLLVKKDLPDINAYWARLFFSGQAQPPRQVSGAEEVLELVAGNKGAIGVVDGARVDRRVRVVLDLGR